MVISRASPARTVVSDQTPSGGRAHGSSISPHSMARPQRLSSIEYGCSLVALIGDVVAGGVLDRVGPGHAPVAHRRHDLEVGSQRAGGHLEAHLVVALARAAVGHGVGAVAAGHLDEVADDDRPRQGRDERVAVLVEGVGPQRRADEVAGELLAAVDHHGVDGAGGQGPGLQGLPVAALADVAGHGDDLDAELLDHPAHGDGRVEAAAVGEHDSLRHGSSAHVRIGSRRIGR